MKFRLFALLAVIAPAAVQSHGVEVRFCITDESTPKLRIFVEHWHNDLTTTASTGTMTIQNDQTSMVTTQSPDGLINNVEGGALGSGCRGGTTTVSSRCNDPNDDWVIYDFPLTCDQLSSYTLVSGNTLVLEEGCGNLYPTVIAGNFACTAPISAPSTPFSSLSPSFVPSSSPSFVPSLSPSLAPSLSPSSAPSLSPSSVPSASPSSQPSLVPSRSSKKGKKEWRLEREARDPNFPPKKPKKSGKVGHGTTPRGDGTSTKAPKKKKSKKSPEGKGKGN